MMNYSEKRRKSLKGPIFAIASFLCIGTGVIVYAMINEKEPIVVGSKGALLTGDSAEVVEQDAFLDLEKEDLSGMYEIRSNLVSDTSNVHIKCDMNIPLVYVNSTELIDFNNSVKQKFDASYNSFKESMGSAQHNFTYKVSYESYVNVVKNNGILSLIITEKMIDDETQKESMQKKYTYNINLLTGEILSQSDVIVDLLGASYRDIVKECLSAYLERDGIVSKENYNYAYTGLENYYIKDDGKLHFIFNSRRLG